MKVPEVLLSGNHGEIAKWREKHSGHVTWAGDGSEGVPAERQARWGGVEPAGPAQNETL